MFAVIHKAASLHMCRKLNFTQINIYDFHCHCTLAKFSSLQIFLAVRYEVYWVCPCLARHYLELLYYQITHKPLYYYTLSINKFGTRIPSKNLLFPQLNKLFYLPFFNASLVIYIQYNLKDHLWV